MKEPKVIEKFADNGEHSHWELMESDTGIILWSEMSPKEAQHWFSVNEEIPDTSDNGVSENVILKLSVYNKKHKNTYECCIEAYYDSDIEHWDFMLPIDAKGLELTPISWRPIERR